ncbi:hypothetical protein NHX12_019677 [Muraenolepis orangiensis]|uniref:Connector enhancer of kinase suppressor of Ras 1 n=1 Tax=Muraenolepis orangiensis TaxID=630683 RepID=A0A9Q0EXT4_9TELE|nr:hypothetical protein NHX12_019677 [Muraenolepis orangiensis]
MESIMSWSKERVDEWLNGLDSPIQQYPFSDWELSGDSLLQLTSEDLQRLGVHKIGHQELILEAVEKLCSLTYGMNGENLCVLTEKLQAVSRSLQKGIQARWCANTYDGQSAVKLPAGVLQLVVELIVSAKGLFSLLNRYQFFQLSGYTTTRSIIDHCQELGTIVHENNSVYEKEKEIIPICRQLVAVCDNILESSPSEVLSNTVQLESVDLVPASTDDHLGIHIASTGASSHIVTGAVAESEAGFCEKILAGDEVIQVNDQIVVGWSRENLLKKLLENPRGVTLVLKKVPGSLRRKHSVARQSSSSAATQAIQGPEERQSPMGQEESELSDRGMEGTLTVTSQYDQQGSLSPFSSAGDSDGPVGPRLSPGIRRDRSPSPRHFSLQGRASISSCPEILGVESTALSRRRVSCRELGRPDCDGWLWKKRKESNVFLAQKWQRFWFVLKGPSLYWYNSPQEEKAEGLMQIPTYSIESAGEHKRKLWINSLIIAIQKHRKFHTDSPDSEAVTQVDEMGKMIKGLKEGGVSLTGQDQPFTEAQFRRSFIRRNKNPIINDKVLTLRALHSTLKAKETELLLIDKVLEDSELTATKFRHWKGRNEELCQEIEKLALLRGSLGKVAAPDNSGSAAAFTEAAEAPVAVETAAVETVATETAADIPDTETEGAAAACGLSLSDGEQLVDAEPSDVLLEIDPGASASVARDSMFFMPELSLGSLQESIKRELSEMETLPGDAAEHYFYI